MGELTYGRSGVQDNLVSLEFGGLVKQGDGSYNASIYGGSDISMSGVDKIAENYAYGFYDCTHTDFDSVVEVALTTSNDLDGTSHPAGHAWASAIQDFQTWLGNHLPGSQVLASGGADIEPGFSGPTSARNLIGGYDEVAPARIVNFGSADGCPTNHVPGPEDCGTADHPGWGPDDIYYVSWGADTAYAAPEIYLENGDQAQQWYWLARWGVINKSSLIGYAASATQHNSCVHGHVGCSGEDNTPEDGYSQLYDALSQSSSTAQTPPATDDFGWEADHV